MGHDYGCHSEDWFQWFSVIIALGVVVTLAASFIVFGDSRAVTNYSIFASNDDVPSSIVGDADGFLRGQLKMNQNQKTIIWDFVYDRLDTITTIFIIGPIGQTSTETGPVKLTLCGQPSTMACDVSIPFKVKGEITQKMPEHGTLREVITTIRKTPAFYKMCVKTTTHQEAAICSNLIPG